MTIQNNHPNMKYFKEWAKDKNIVFAVIAFEIASTVEDCLELWKSIKEGKRIEGDVALPHLKNWLKMYQNHHKVLIGLFTALGKQDSRFKGVAYSYRMLLKDGNEIQKMSPEVIKERRNEIQRMMAEEKNQIMEDVTQALKKYQQMAVNVTDDGREMKETDEYKKKSDIFFRNIKRLSMGFLVVGTIMVC